MRQITKGAEPVELTFWKAENRSLPNNCYASLTAELRQAIRVNLISEQKGLCAYTGRRIGLETCHIEHLRPQEHCGDDEDVDYRNLVAGVPAPNAPRLPYGAHRKDNWPSRADEHLFVSPLTVQCGTRFSFGLNGGIEARNVGDLAAKETIKRLGLNDSTLVQLRKAAIEATLQIRGRGRGSLGIADARRRLRMLEDAERQAGTLEPYSFVLAQALGAHIRRIEKIREGRGRK